jgi:protease-4
MRFARLAFLILLGFAGGCSIPTVLVQPVSNSPELQETVARPGETNRRKIALIAVEGTLVNGTTGGGFLGTEENKVSRFRQELAAAASDDRVKAVVLRINSPGGTVAASQAMWTDLQAFKKSTGKPVLAACQDIAASGGYYVAVAADEIHATPGGVVGSIGVIFQTVNLQEMLDKVGVSVRPIVSGPLKTLGSPFDGLSETETAVLQSIIDDFYQQFVEVVLNGRDISDTTIAFDGRVFSATQAQAIGLIDRVAGLDETLNRAAELADARGATVIQYKRPYGYRGSIYANTPQTPQLPGSREVSEMARLLMPGAFYLWMP